MLQTAPPIQAPTEHVLAKLSKLLHDRTVLSGPVLCFDPSRHVFLVAVVEQGVLVHWQIESCHDQAEAEALRHRYSGYVDEALAALPPDARADLERSQSDLASPREIH